MRELGLGEYGLIIRIKIHKRAFGLLGDISDEVDFKLVHILLG